MGCVDNVDGQAYSQVDLTITPPGPAPTDVHLDMQTLNTLVASGLMTELDYMTADQAEAAIALEAELLADAAAGVDLRIRLVGAAVSA